MATPEQTHGWNYEDEIGSIEPPLTPAEVDALARHNISPSTPIRYGIYSEVARTAFIACSSMRITGNPELTAQAVAAFK